jgi:hypothetical protein
VSISDCFVEDQERAVVDHQRVRTQPSQEAVDRVARVLDLRREALCRRAVDGTIFLASRARNFGIRGLSPAPTATAWASEASHVAAEAFIA